MFTLVDCLSKWQNKTMQIAIELLNKDDPSSIDLLNTTTNDFLGPIDHLNELKRYTLNGLNFNMES